MWWQLRGWFGRLYRDQSSDKPFGCDCFKLTRGVWREAVGPEPCAILPYRRDWGEARAYEVRPECVHSGMIEIEPLQLECGALLLFRMAPRAVAKHVGTDSAPNRFIHAHGRLGVIEQPLTQFWPRRTPMPFCSRG